MKKNKVIKRTKIFLPLIMFLLMISLSGCINVATPIPDVEVIKAANQYNTAVFANDEGNNGFFVKRIVDGVIGCYNVSWNEETNKIDSSTISGGELVFDVEDEHLKLHNITDFELLNVYLDTYYYVYILANEKIYEYVLDYTNDSMFLVPLHFSYINFREVNCLVDGFNQVVNARYNSLIVESDDENLLENIPNTSLVNVYGMNYLYLDENGYLVYQNVSKNNPVTYTFIEEKVEVVHCVMNNNYANILTTNNKLYKLNFDELTLKEIETINVEYMVTTVANNYFALVDDGKIKVYNYLLELVSEITPTQPTSEIVGVCLSFEGASKYKRLILTTAYLNDNVLYRVTDEIKLS